MRWSRYIGPHSAAIAALAVQLFAQASSAQLNCNAGVEYYPNGGGIKRCTLNGHHTIYTAKGLKVICADGKSLMQYPDGAVQSCSIETPHIFEGVRCDPPSDVSFERDGSLLDCRPT